MNPSTITLGELAKPLLGYYFKDGNLFRFDKKRDVMIESWPGLKAWSRKRRGVWKPDFEGVDRLMSSVFQLWSKFVISDVRGTQPSSPRGEARDSSALISYLAGIPADLREEVSRYGERCWYMLRMFTEFPESIDLSRSNPALALAIANAHKFVQGDVSASSSGLRSLLSGKQKSILLWLGFPGSDAVRRIMRKVSIQGLNVEYLLCLRDVLKSEKKKQLLGHLPVVNRHVIKAIADESFVYVMNPRLLASLAEQPDLDPDVDSLIDSVDDTACMIRIIEDRVVELANCADDNEERIYTESLLRQLLAMARNVSCYSQLQVLHDGVSDLLREFYRCVNCNEKFGVCPFPGDQELIPLTTSNDLLKESIEMHNCVASYAERVMDGDIYIYKLLSPVRATVSVVRDTRRDHWRIGEVSSYCNAPVDDKVKLMLERKLNFPELPRVGL